MPDLPFSRTTQWKITPSIDVTNGIVFLDTEDWGGKITREVMRTKEAAVREALIALGWTPPLEPPEWMEFPRDTRNDQELCQH